MSDDSVEYSYHDVIEIKYKLNQGSGILFKATLNSSGYDIRTIKPYKLFKNTPTLIETGLFLDMPEGYEAQIRSRSGLALNDGIFVLNSPGTIDADYRGEIKVILLYIGNEKYKEINKDDRIAQIVFCKLPKIKLIKTENLSTTTRNTNGFGSTGKT